MKPTKQVQSLKQKLNTSAIAVLILVGLLMVANVFLSAQASHLGLELNQLQLQANHIDQKNDKISQEIVKNTSLTDFQSQASKLGFTHQVEYLHLGEDPSLASAQ
jgi:cell division protein FtsL